MAKLEKIGKFQVTREIGKGATASVYVAEDPFTGDEVAIKAASQGVFLDPVNGPKFKKMFMNEASLAGKLHHPHIIRVFDAGIENDTHYIVMEYVPGTTLKTYCDPGNLMPIQRVTEIIFKCCKALEYAWQYGLIHRDIKPANIMFLGDTEIKVADFGAALHHTAEQTQVVGAVGSPAYMSPEQIKGQDLNNQTDIYSLGVVFYQMLTGKLPFVADSEYGFVNKILNDEAKPLREIRPEIPEEIERIVKRAMNKNREQRYGAWADFSDDLSKVFPSSNNDSEEENSDTKRYNTLTHLEFFKDFSETELWELVRISKWKIFPKDAVLLQEDKVGKSFFILASGEARVTKSGKLLGLIKPGDSFGEMVYINEAQNKRSATITTNAPILLIKIQAESLREASNALQARFNKKFLTLLAERLARADQLIAVL
ncbi:MAG: hypothetical protein BMS9Abin36_0911 [Gammaproteobacteria bacterium]|nr:MAG: hypothetical protein BMS9Abin36_0911 [Gammaproteobacteria bacterium]